MSRNRHLWRPLAALMAMAALAMAPAMSTPACAQTGEEPPIVLGGNPIVREDRIQLLREEFRERQHEIKESRERARYFKKHPNGKKAEYRLGDEDQVSLSATARQPGTLGALGTMITPSNSKANNKTADAAGAGQAEQSIAFLGLNGLCAWNDGQGFNLSPQDVQGFGYTVDGGLTWTDLGIPMKAGTIATWTSDPVVTVNEKTGNFYYCGLTTNTGTANGVGVLRGHFAAGSFVQDAATMVASGANSSNAFDKQWMCADSLNGNLYVTYTKFVVGGGHIWFARSTDNGATWSTPVQISKTWENGLVSGSRPAVGPNGELYIVYSALGAVDADSIKIVKSTDGGVTFGPSYVAGIVMDNYFTGAPGFNRGRAVTFPAIAVDRSTGPNRGRVYVTYQDAVNFYYDALGGGTAKSEVEVNGNFANATPFTIGQTLRGAISNASTDQIDNWKFTATQGTTYVFFVDSVRTSTFKYTMRLYCPKDTVAVSRLAMSSDGSSSSSVNVHALIVWTAPENGTYYLRMQFSTSTGGYRIRSGSHTTVPADVARDARDVVAISSPDGTVTWSGKVRMNDDAPLYDNWLPEVAVPCDGNLYAMWFDWRDTPASCFGGSNIYLSRSTNAGVTWGTNQVVTTATTANWTQVLSNIAPNQGDYNGMYGGDAIGMAFADGRLGDADIYTARVGSGFTTYCGNDTTVYAGNTLNLALPVTNNNGMYPATASYSFTADRSWPGLPASGSLPLSELASGLANLSVVIPDTAATGPVRICLTVNCDNGACAKTCCLTLNVLNLATPALASLVSAQADPGAVKVRWNVSVSEPVVVYRSTGAAWARIGMRVPDGDGFVEVQDTDVAAGTRYGYRLGIAQSGREVAAGETWVTVPAGAQFALHGARPNPTTGPLAISFSLANSAPATLELIDLNGRRVFERSVGSLGAGYHVVPVDGGAKLPAGMYLVRLSQGPRTVTAKVSVVH
jgi:hypothetical protein